jgi:hypothetical protein
MYLTCGRFTYELLEPALDILWRDLAALSPLIQCLSSDLWVVQKGEASHRTEIVSYWMTLPAISRLISSVVFLQPLGRRRVDQS